MALNKVEICGVNTSKLPLLKESEKDELLLKIKCGDKEARQIFIKGNLRLVLSVIKRFSNSNENADDLFQIGCIGLIKAIDNFDINQQVKFSTYAVPMIIGEIRRYLRDNNSIRVSRSIKDLAYNSMKEKERITLEKGREATVDEIAESLGETVTDVMTALDSVRSPVSIFEPIYNDGGDTIYLCDQIEDERLQKKDLDVNLALEDAIRDLSERERKIIDERYIIGKTQIEIASELGISQAQISRLEKNAIKTLKKVLR